MCVCVVFPLQEVVSVLKFRQSRFWNFFIIVPSFLEVLLTSSSFSSTILWWLPSLSFLVQKFLTSKNFTTLKKWFAETLTHKVGWIVFFEFLNLDILKKSEKAFSESTDVTTGCCHIRSWKKKSVPDVNNRVLKITDVTSVD